VEALAAVQRLERAQQRPEHAEQPRLGDAARLLLGQAAQRAALVELDRHVGGGVGLPEAMHPHQRRMAELRERARLVDEAAQPGLEGGREPLGAHVHAVVAHAAREHRGHVLLDGHLALQRVVVRAVDDAEAALADHLQQFELVEPVAHAERVRPFLRVVRIARIARIVRGRPRAPRPVPSVVVMLSPPAVGRWRSWIFMPMAHAPAKTTLKTAVC
jgi:hypothetical protein